MAKCFSPADHEIATSPLEGAVRLGDINQMEAIWALMGAHQRASATDAAWISFADAWGEWSNIKRKQVGDWLAERFGAPIQAGRPHERVYRRGIDMGDVDLLVAIHGYGGRPMIGNQDRASDVFHAARAVGLDHRKNDRLKVLACVLEHSAELGAISGEGEALTIAAQCADPQMMALLLEAGVTVPRSHSVIRTCVREAKKIIYDDDHAERLAACVRLLVQAEGLLIDVQWGVGVLQGDGRSRQQELGRKLLAIEQSVVLQGHILPAAGHGPRRRSM